MVVQGVCCEPVSAKTRRLAGKIQGIPHLERLKPGLKPRYPQNQTFFRESPNIGIGKQFDRTVTSLCETGIDYAVFEERGFTYGSQPGASGF